MLRRLLSSLAFLGPAFVASVAYVDPGNVAANLTAGAEYQYRLLWVLALSSLIAVVVQYQSAKLGVVTGESLSALVSRHLVGRRAGRLWRGLYALQAMAMAIATDIAEVIGGALALNLLFGVPLWIGGILVGVVTLLLLEALRRRGEHAFEVVVTGVLGLVAVGFMAGLLWAPPSASMAVRGLVPDFPDGRSVSLSAAMLGATVMPHAIYLHSTLAADRHRPGGRLETPIPQLLRSQRLDVVLALAVAGSVNIAMLLFAAAALAGHPATDSIETAHDAIRRAVGAASATVFALGLLVSGLGSALVGTHAGARIMRDLVPWQVHPKVRRAVTIVPAVLLLTLGLHPTTMLVTSQLVLSFGIAFALLPLILLTGSRRVMGEFRDSPAMRVLCAVLVALVVGLNLALIAQSVP